MELVGHTPGLQRVRRRRITGWRKRGPRARRLRRRGIVMWLALWFACGLQEMSFAADLPSQQEVEAVYLFDFGKFVRWPPAGSQGPMQICIASSDSFAAGITRTVAGEQIDGRALEVRRITRAEEEAGCSIVYFDGTQKEHAEELLTAAEGKPILTVSDLAGFLERGGMIQFQLVQNRVRFSVNLAAVSRSNLAISSELLKVALRVQGSAPAGGVH